MSGWITFAIALGMLALVIGVKAEHLSSSWPAYLGVFMVGCAIAVVVIMFVVRAKRRRQQEQDNDN